MAPGSEKFRCSNIYFGNFLAHFWEKFQKFTSATLGMDPYIQGSMDQPRRHFTKNFGETWEGGRNIQKKPKSILNNDNIR
jgi:hypothetical protein